MMDENSPDKLRELALWYREFAERAGNPTIWESRLRTAEDLDAAAERVERNFAAEPGVTESRLQTSAQPADLER
jgi:hypothetical protein